MSSCNHIKKPNTNIIRKESKKKTNKQKKKKQKQVGKQSSYVYIQTCRPNTMIYTVCCKEILYAYYGKKGNNLVQALPTKWWVNSRFHSVLNLIHPLRLDCISGD